MIKESDYIVYLHINKINKKTYVGITSSTNNPQDRWRYGHGYKRCEIMHRAIKKYGWDNFKHIVLCRTTKAKARLLEATLIWHYKHKGISYNISNGGEGTGVVSESTKEKLRQYVGEKSSMYGKHPSEETIRRRIETRKRLNHYDKSMPWLAIYRLRKGKDSPLYGKRPSDSTLNAHRKPILQYDSQGNFIKEFPSIKDAAKEANISSPALVNCLKGKTKKAGGFKWKYKNE